MSSLYTKAVVCFCEGPHDMAFLRLVLKHFFGASRIERKFKDYPSPFNLLFKKSIEKHAGMDLSLDMSHKFFLPDKILGREDYLFLLFNCGGHDKVDNQQKLLQELDVLLKQADVFAQGAPAVISTCKALFLYDADDEGPTKAAERCSSILASPGCERWAEESVVIQPNSCSCQCKNVAVYVWSSQNMLSGTLEDTILPIYSDAYESTVKSANEFLVSQFTWDTNSASQKTSIAELARLKKATITLLGQRKKPGGSLNVIIDQSELIDSSHLVKSAAVMRFVEFLSGFTGLTSLIKFEEA